MNEIVSLNPMTPTIFSAPPLRGAELNGKVFRGNDRTWVALPGSITDGERVAITREREAIALHQRPASGDDVTLLTGVLQARPAQAASKLANKLIAAEFDAVLIGMPVGPLAEACRAISDGTATDVDPVFRPTPAVIAKLTRLKAAKYEQRLAEIDRVLGARTPTAVEQAAIEQRLARVKASATEPTPEERAVVGPGLEKISRDLKKRTVAEQLRLERSLPDEKLGCAVRLTDTVATDLEGLALLKRLVAALENPEMRARIAELVPDTDTTPLDPQLVKKLEQEAARNRSLERSAENRARLASIEPEEVFATVTSELFGRSSAA